MTMRIVCNNDSEALAAIHAQVFQHEVWDRVAIDGLLVMPGTFAFSDEGLSGFVMARAAGDEAEVLTLAVIPAARRRGVGKCLIYAAADRAYQAGAKVMFLEVNGGNYPATELYKSVGFVEVGVRKAYYAMPHGMREDALVLRACFPLLRV